VLLINIFILMIKLTWSKLLQLWNNMQYNGKFYFSFPGIRTKIRKTLVKERTIKLTFFYHNIKKNSQWKLNFNSFLYLYNKWFKCHLYSSIKQMWYLNTKQTLRTLCEQKHWNSCTSNQGICHRVSENFLFFKYSSLNI